MLRAGLVALVWWVVMPPAIVTGQSPRRGEDRGPGRLSVILELGGASGGPGRSLAAQLRQAGYGDTAPASCLFELVWCSGSKSYPQRDDVAGAFGIAARLTVRPAVAVGFGVTSTDLGGARGYKAGNDIRPEAYLASDWSVVTRWAGAFLQVQARSELRMGIGPALYRLEGSPDPLSVNRTGAVGEFGFEWPARPGLVLDLAFRYYWIPSTDVAHREGDNMVMLRPSWSYSSFQAGFGIRM